jgi:CRISPR-associated protein Cmr2
MKQYFHLTIGPVQGFVAQARRSKDLWGGSFLLSWLSAVAIASVRSQHDDNQIMFPLPDENFMAAVTGDTTLCPKQGGIPNRFKGMTAQVAVDFPAKDVIKTVQLAWQQLAELVWHNDLAPFFAKHSECNLQQSRQIWDRQVQYIWEISWVLTDDPSVSNLLDRRKNWRNHYAPPEPGDKCMMMAGWQELSGENHAKKRTAFWEKLRQSMAKGKTDLEEAEQLCALGFIKRRFAHYFSEFNFDAGQATSSSTLKQIKLRGWSFANVSATQQDYDPTHVPSLPYLAALPYMRSAYQKIAEQPELTSSYQRFADKSHKQLGLAGRFVQFNSLDHLSQKTPLPSWVNHLDGISFYPASLMAGKNYQDLPVQDIERSFHAFNQHADLAPASPFYALLIMDGDSLGSQMSDPAKQQGISRALNAFTQDAPAIVQQHDGFLIYAGGDDVLALLPMDTAISCARALALVYQTCFAKVKGNTSLASTLSGAIQFAHYRTPLMKIVSQAHQLLDDVAKDQTGRDALAIRINKPGGLHAQWAMPWQSLYPNNSNTSLLDTALNLFATKHHNVTNRLLFKLTDVLSIFSNQTYDLEQVEHLAKAEYFHSGSLLQIEKKELQQDLVKIRGLLEVCQSYQRSEPDKQGNSTIKNMNMLQLDGLKIVRFIATKGIEQQESHA